MASMLCKKCGDTSTDDEFCSECGSPMAGAVALPQSGSPVTSVQNTTSVASGSTRRGSVVATQVGGYAKATGRVNGVRRPQAHASGTGTGTVGSALTRASGSTRRGSSSSKRTRALGSGMVTMPIMVSREPELRILKDPRVPDSKLVCAGVFRDAADPADTGKPCGARLNPDRKFCSRCGTAYRLKPALVAGDVVAGQYEIRGAMAFGGLGWIYLGMDSKLNRWVVLKGLLNASDEAAAAAAVAERQFLAKVKNGKIVGIYNFVTHGSESYIVMEYVGGSTLKEIRKERGPLPAKEAISYILGILPAFGYLHASGLVYCDFKPDNFMVEGDDVKLIDMGAVRQIGDPNGDVYGTRGYMSPESGDNPTASSDLYTIGRTLAVLLMDFENLKEHEFDLPSPSAISQIVPSKVFETAGFTSRPSCTACLADGSALPFWLSFQLDDRGERWYFTGTAPVGVFEIPVKILATGTNGKGADFQAQIDILLALPLAEYESLYRFVLKATANDPDGRFQSAEEMSAQLLGVLREIVAREGKIPAAESVEFMPERSVAGSDPVLLRDGWKRLPEPKLDPEDSAAADLFSAATISDMESRRTALIAICKGDQESSEARLRLADLLLGGLDIQDSTEIVRNPRGTIARAVSRLDASEAVHRLEKNKEAITNNVMLALDSAAAIDAFDWRPDWYCGRLYLALGRFTEAVVCFDRVYSEIPGECTPKLALALALEGCSRHAEAAGLYDTVSRTDPSLSGASIGLARCRVATGDRAGAVEAFCRVQSSSATHAEAMLAAVLALGDATKAPPSRDDIVQAGGILAAMTREDVPHQEAVASISVEAARQIEAKTMPAGTDLLLGARFTANSLRLRAEKALHACARMVTDKPTRLFYIDRANAVRPWSTF